MASGRPKKQNGTATSNEKLGRTILDLEAALADWDSLPSETAPAAPEPAPQNELRKKTKQLLAELKEQLAALDD